MNVRSLTVRRGDRTYEIRVEGPGDDGTVAISGRRRQGDAPPLELETVRARLRLRPGEVELATGTAVERCAVARDGRGVWVARQGRTAYFERGSPGSAAARSAAAPDDVRAPMTGMVLEVRARPGAPVRREQLLAVLEAMKMEYRLTAPRDGEVAAVNVKPGDRVELGQVVVSLRPVQSERAPGPGARAGLAAATAQL